MKASIDRKPQGASSAADEQVERILGELEPIVARTREALARVWHDRSVSKANLHVLMLLEQFGALSMSRLAAQIGVSFPNMTGIVDRMEENGLVERVRSDDDRRIVLVRSTTRGAELAAELPELRRAYLRRVIAALPEEDRRTCYDAFRAFRRAADTLAEEPQQDHEHHVPSCTGKPAGSRTGRRRERSHSGTAATSKE